MTIVIVAMEEQEAIAVRASLATNAKLCWSGLDLSDQMKADLKAVGRIIEDIDLQLGLGGNRALTEGEWVETYEDRRDRS